MGKHLRFAFVTIFVLAILLCRLHKQDWDLKAVLYFMTRCYAPDGIPVKYMRTIVTHNGRSADSVTARLSLSLR